MNNIKKISPWAWVPTLYFAQGIPYFIVNNISVLMFAKMGVPNGDMALFTSLLYLPWTIKPFWSPFVDIIKTKRWWVVSMQILMSIAFILLTLTIPRPDEATMAAGTTPISMFTITLVLFIITAFASATHDIAADGFYMLALDSHRQALLVGIRSTFYRIATIAGQGLLIMLAGRLEIMTDNIPYAWSITFFVLAGLFLGIWIYHKFVLPCPDSDHTSKEVSASNLLKKFFGTFASFFQKKQAGIAILFMLLYRLPEAQLAKMCIPFLIDPVEKGGLGLTTEEIGFVQGTVGIIGLTLGGILGGIAVARNGLKQWLWPMVWAISLPDLVYVYLSYIQPDSLYLINICIFIEQFGYGFGFTAYMLYLIYFADGEHKTAHYAICTAFMALGMMIPGMAAGWLQEQMGYTHFFIWIMICCVITFGVTALLKIDPEFGKKKG